MILKRRYPDKTLLPPPALPYWLCKPAQHDNPKIPFNQPIKEVQNGSLQAEDDSKPVQPRRADAPAHSPSTTTALPSIIYHRFLFVWKCAYFFHLNNQLNALIKHINRDSFLLLAVTALGGLHYLLRINAKKKKW